MEIFRKDKYEIICDIFNKIYPYIISLLNYMLKQNINYYYKL